MKNFPKYSNDSEGELECYFQTILAMITQKKHLAYQGDLLSMERLNWMYKSMFYLVVNRLYSFTTEIIFILKFILILHPDSKEFEIF